MKTFTVSTKPSKDGEEVKTVLTIDTDCPTEVLLALAIQSAVIKWQGHARKHGIPATATIKLADLAPGRRMAAGPMSKDQILAQAKVMSKEERAALLAALQSE